MGRIYQKSSETQNTTRLDITLYHFAFLPLFCNRDGEENKNGTDRVHLVTWRPLWALPWLQLHLLLRDHLLGNHCPCQVSCYEQHLAHYRLIRNSWRNMAKKRNVA